ncbi:MAG: 3-hydroxyacyl-ACP dehydratase FabZ family protein [Planctomycetota bacterium]
MARALVDLATLDLGSDVLPEEELRALLPHRYEFQLIDGVCHLDLEKGVIVAYKNWDQDPWWARGHVPGRPLMPGVLIAEGAAQTASILMKKSGACAPERFIGLGGLDNVRFRGQVIPPATVHWVSVIGTTSGSRLAKYPAQAFCGGKLVMEMDLLGVIL